MFQQRQLNWAYSADLGHTNNFPTQHLTVFSGRNIQVSCLYYDSPGQAGLAEADGVRERVEVVDTRSELAKLGQWDSSGHCDPTCGSRTQRLPV